MRTLQSGPWPPFQHFTNMTDQQRSSSAPGGVDVDAELAQLLREQEQFLQRQERPAASVSRSRPGGVKASPQEQQQHEQQPPESGPQVLGRVVERDVVRLELQGAAVAPIHREATGFPAVRRREAGQSLFGKRRRQAGTAPTTSASIAGARKPKEKELEPVDQEHRDIDAANRARLQEMTPAEILEAQQELLRSLDPELVAKLKGRRTRGSASKTNSVKATTDKKKTVVVAGQAVVTPAEQEAAALEQKQQLSRDLSSIQTEEELQAQTQLLPPEERAKLDWTKPTTQRKAGKDPSAKKKLPRPVGAAPTLERFDLNGQVLHATDAEVPTHSGLFHHGEDPEAAGYTMLELLHLARSSVSSQRAMALTVVAKILRRRQQGASIEVSPRVLPRDLAITLRIALDDQNYTALSAGVSALHAFLVPQSAQTARLPVELSHGTVILPSKVHLHRNQAADQGLEGVNQAEESEDVVYIDASEADDGSSISDEDLAALDPVQALLHMDLPTRLRFIMESVQLPDQDATEKMLELLLVVARHSPRGAQAIGSNARLMKLLQAQYIENDQVLSFQSGNSRALKLTLKALELVRALCQGERSVASILITNGVIQSTKGFLALTESPVDAEDEEAAGLFSQIQVESLRIWRVLLGYGLDFHCFAYLFPVLSNFVQQAPAATKASTARSTALFAALEAFCGLGELHEAQHYFPQLGFFLQAAESEAIRGLRGFLVSSGAEEELVLVATALRFLSASSALATKFGLEAARILNVWELLQSRDVAQKLLPLLTTADTKRELLIAIVRLQFAIVNADLLGDDVDDVEVRMTLARHVQTPLLNAASCAVSASSSTFSSTSIQACELLELLGTIIASPSSVYTECIREVYTQTLRLVQRLGPGGEFWLGRLFSAVLFHPKVLHALGMFTEEADALRMSHVLVPVYQALVSSSINQEAHEQQLLGGSSAIRKTSYHLRLPQEEQEYVCSNLPLPSFWLYAPLSRSVYTNTKTDVDPSKAQSDEMTLIVSATCRFVFAFEQSMAPKLTSGPTLKPEDKLFHLFHVFFAGSDVLFDEHVDLALRQLLPTLVAPMLQPSKPSRSLYDGLLRNLQRFQQLESEPEAKSESEAKLKPAFSSADQQVLTFVEKLVAEFTASSYGNPHFAKCIALLVTRDFPLALRKFVWKELQDCRLLHVLEPFDESVSELLARCSQGGLPPFSDPQLLRLMTQATCQQQVTPTRGVFAYTLAVQYLVSFLFSDVDGVMSFERQQLAQTLAATAPSTLWSHLLSYDGVKNPVLLTEERGIVDIGRVARIRTQAELPADQRLTFEAALALLERS
ncbi:hypothetical protein BBJ28_00017853 [Nothophytophthora sp. Chile5]|nr:hypothetical protein BBJ28_00017853 [Nothophytophthora sp. Chile5]